MFYITSGRQLAAHQPSFNTPRWFSDARTKSENGVVFPFPPQSASRRDFSKIMILDDIEFDSLTRADILLLAHLRPRLWSFTLCSDALADENLRDKLTREVARRAANVANERARLAFEQSEDLPFPDSARQTRLDELADAIELESLRARWLECAETDEGREQLRILENLPLRSSHADGVAAPAWAKIIFGLSRGFADEAHDLKEISTFIADYLARENANWNVTITPIRVCYYSKDGARDEAGVEIGLISDPRAPLGNYELARRALKLADEAREKFGQHRLCVSFPDCVVMLEGAGAPLP